MKRSVILTDRLGPDILSAFWTKGQVLHRVRAHLKVPGFSIVLNVLLTRKLPTFLPKCPFAVFPYIRVPQTAAKT